MIDINGRMTTDRQNVKSDKDSGIHDKASFSRLAADK